MITSSVACEILEGATIAFMQEDSSPSIMQKDPPRIQLLTVVSSACMLLSCHQGNTLDTFLFHEQKEKNVSLLVGCPGAEGTQSKSFVSPKGLSVSFVQYDLS